MIGDKAPGMLEKDDWENANRLIKFLENFKKLTERVSATQHVTMHTLFHEIGDVKITLQEWCDSEDEVQKAMGERMIAKYNKYWGKPEDMNMFIFIAVALDPRYKLSEYTKGFFLEMFGDSKGNDFWNTIVQSFRSLFDEYRNMYAVSDKALQSNDSQEVAQRGTGKMKFRVAQKMRMGSCQFSTSRSDIDKYLAEENEPDTADFDILDWWKKSSQRLPILSLLACDVLAIPVSTVASESAFSTGGRILDEFRSSLTPFTVQALICAQDWFRGSLFISHKEEPGELLLLEEAMLGERDDTGSKSKTTPQGTSKPNDG